MLGSEIDVCTCMCAARVAPSEQVHVPYGNWTILPSNGISRSIQKWNCKVSGLFSCRLRPSTGYVESCAHVSPAIEVAHRLSPLPTDAPIGQSSRLHTDSILRGYMQDAPIHAGMAVVPMYLPTEIRPFAPGLQHEVTVEQRATWKMLASEKGTSMASHRTLGE